MSFKFLLAYTLAFTIGAQPIQAGNHQDQHAQQIEKLSHTEPPKDFGNNGGYGWVLIPPILLAINFIKIDGCQITTTQLDIKTSDDVHQGKNEFDLSTAKIPEPFPKSYTDYSYFASRDGSPNTARIIFKLFPPNKTESISIVRGKTLRSEKDASLFYMTHLENEEQSTQFLKALRAYQQEFCTLSN